MSETVVEKNNYKVIPWGPVAAVIVTTLTYAMSQIMAGMLLWIYPIYKGWDEKTATSWLASSPYIQFVFVLVVEVIALWFLWMFLKGRLARPSQLGLRAPRTRDVGYALTGFVAYFSLYLVLLTVMQKLIPSLNTDQKQELGFATDTGGVALVAVFISLVILPPIVEEIMTRGFLYSGLRSKLPKVVAAIITSILFAVAHLQFGSGNSLLWVAAIDTFILSMVLVYLRDKTDSLWSPFMLHGLKNTIAFVSIFVLHLS